MRKVIALLALLAVTLAFLPLPAEGGRIVIAFDVSHRQSPAGLEVLALPNMTGGMYRVLIVFDDSDLQRIPNATQRMFNEIRRGGFTAENLRDVDVLIIGMPEAALRSGELDVLKAWFSQPNRALWIAADSDYPAQGSERAQQFMNQVLEALGSVIRIDHISVEEPTFNIGGAAYRVMGTIDPSPDIASIIMQGVQHRRALFHGPGGLYILVNNKPVNPVKEPDQRPRNIHIIVRTTNESRVVDNNPAERGGLPPVFYDPLGPARVSRGPYPLMLAETFPNNRIIIASSETPYGGYQHMTISAHRGVALDGHVLVRNLLVLMNQVVVKPQVVTEVRTEIRTVTATREVTQLVTQVTTVTETRGLELPIAAGLAVLALLAGVAIAFVLRR
ncbi:MAG: hypothetical protein NZ902_03600 [Acidilobaceae archaeon]|nr:hypothetical protein [Acidilobaceae archaeon]MCX8165186.1 hypothetical protein [Acidilobaceae archaeon]MDW7974298.1 hypothetical protein [Sulfolobales archaeon]